MKILIVAVMACMACQMVQSAPSDKIDCSKIEEVLDDLGSLQGLSVLNEKHKLATNKDEMTKRCVEQKAAIQTLKKYNKECYTALTEQVFGAILRTRAAMTDTYCTPDSKEFDAATAASKCISENAIDTVKDAERKAILQAQVIHDSNIPDEKLRMRRSCCAVIAGKTLVLDATKAKCAAHEKILTDYLDSYTAEAFSLICQEPDKLDCGKLEPLKIDGVTPKYQFFLNPTLKLVKSLDH